VAGKDASKSGDRKGMQQYEVGDETKTDNFNCRGTDLASLGRHSTQMVSIVAGGNMQKATILSTKMGNLNGKLAEKVENDIDCLLFRKPMQWENSLECEKSTVPKSLLHNDVARAFNGDWGICNRKMIV